MRVILRDASQDPAPTVAPAVARPLPSPPRPRRVGRTPLLGRLPLKQQVNLLLGVIAIGLTLALGFGAYDSRSTKMLAAQNEVVGDALMHSQRLAKAAGIAVQGSTLAYDQLQDSVKQLTAAARCPDQGRHHRRPAHRPVWRSRCCRRRRPLPTSGATWRRTSAT